jgi:RNA polymerase sigma-70 factor (ECF subfamily)
MLDAEIEDLYGHYGHYLFERCKNMLGSEDEAYDALQEVFMRVVKTRPVLDQNRSPLAWLNRVTTNLCLNRLRARRYRNHYSIDDVRELADCSPSVFVARLTENRQLVRSLLSRVDERTQRVVVSYFFDEHTAAQVANEYKLSIPTVRRLIKRFLTQARTQLANEMPISETSGRRLRQ